MFAGDETPLARAWIGGTYQIVGADSLAEDSLARLLAMESDSATIESSLQDFSMSLGRVDDALTLLESAYDNHEESASWLLAMPGLVRSCVAFDQPSFDQRRARP